MTDMPEEGAAYCRDCGYHIDWHDNDFDHLPGVKEGKPDDLCATPFLEVHVVPAMSELFWDRWYDHTDRSTESWKQIWADWLQFIGEING